ncbi:MAG: amidohydrolase family protein, partial [Gammaproteobacteria bacterium]|nr:amidohydrolase family protein [Gammaproteobacteria bacterium]
TYAKQVYTSLVDTLLANGTTTAVYFGTVHLAATQCLADICMERGQRAIVGKVVMDNVDECPNFYRDVSTNTAIDDTRAFIEYVFGMDSSDSSLVKPAVTPRFIPSCTDDALTALGKLAREYDCHIQTHCSESDWEHNYVLERHDFTDSCSLNNCDLITDKTVLAHCNFIDDADMNVIKNAESGIAHCPLSNYYFSNAVFPARRALDKGLLVGLGTDISGGPSASILDNCSHAINASRALEEGVNPSLAADERCSPNARIDFKEAFWMATTGGAQALKLKVGQFTPGYEFDAMLIDTRAANSNLVDWDDDSQDDVLQKIIYSARRQNIRQVWVKGKTVHKNH